MPTASTTEAEQGTCGSQPRSPTDSAEPRLHSSFQTQPSTDPTASGQAQGAEDAKDATGAGSSPLFGHFWITIPEMFLKFLHRIFLQIRYLANLVLILHLLAIRGYGVTLEVFQN